MNAREERAARTAEAQGAEWRARAAESLAMSERAGRSLAGGVTSAWQIAWPSVPWLERGLGPNVWDVDGNQYLDMHGGFGVTVAGHCHPALTDALGQRLRSGTHFAQPTEEAVIVASALAERFGLPLWRFCNTGTEATMNAAQLMRACTGRPLLIKVEGHYHGHHDALHFSVAPNPEEAGEPLAPRPVPATPGISPGVNGDLVIVGYNDLASVRSALERHTGAVAGMILEPLAMNPVPISPAEGYLRGLRELLDEHDALLAFDEVQTGLTVHPGGATRMYAVEPDLVCVSKALGGGIPVAAIGGTERAMGPIADGRYSQVGTFNGNPMAMTAARVMLNDILTPEALVDLTAHADELVVAADAILREHGVPAHALGMGAKGAVVFGRPLTDFRSSWELPFVLTRAHSVYQLNHGVLLPPWGKWLLSVTHDRTATTAYLDNLRGFLAEIS